MVIFFLIQRYISIATIRSVFLFSTKWQIQLNTMADVDEQISCLSAMPAFWVCLSVCMCVLLRSHVALLAMVNGYLMIESNASTSINCCLYWVYIQLFWFACIQSRSMYMCFDIWYAWQCTIDGLVQLWLVKISQKPFEKYIYISYSSKAETKMSYNYNSGK